MKQAMTKCAVALSSIAMLLGLAACSERNSTTIDTPQAKGTVEQRSDTTAMGGPAASSDNSTSPLGKAVDDAQIVAKLKSEFAADKDISAMAIDIDSKEGMVTLSGTVPNSDAKVRADQIAKAMPDVKSVNNQLEVKAG